MFCPAKINLFLKVLGQRQDGYHDLETIFLPIHGLSDDLKARLLEDPQQPPTMTVNGDFPVPTDGSNLCLKAARAFQEATHTPGSVAFTLTKNIPVAAGLGGGSSDAAVALKLLNRLHHTRLNAFQLRAIARTLGADIPFFIQPQVALGTGIGDILTPVPLKTNLTILLVTPCFPLPVAWAYKHRLTPTTPQPELPDLQRAMLKGNPQEVAKLCRNDLEHAIFKKFPILELMRSTLLQLGAYCVHVSGSGPSLFAILDPQHAHQTQDSFRNTFPGFPRTSLHTITVI